ncbi:MAG: DUF362 domain-containing protein [Candidatus Omnitrophica bacterium]|nr:DUF362 domain-containing protein [Candidatus Omnitrophota bacterium]
MSKVYFLETDLKTFEREPKMLVNFLDKTELFSLIKNKSLVGIKMHFGEDKNKGYLKPHYIKGLVEKIKRLGANPFLFDTNTLYRGKRTNSVDHFNLAFFGHNFKTLNIPLIIGGGLKSKEYIEVDVSGKHFKKAKITSLLRDVDVVLVLSHLTGHMLTGFGAAIKNLGMGCASRAGKMEQHCEVSPSVRHDICVKCKKCISTCLAEAISLKEDKILIDKAKCTGCAQCISECPKGAIKIAWSEDYALMQEKMVEYAKAACDLCGLKFFVNFSLFVTEECDCMSKEGSPAALDSGILASVDPLSLDKASVDLAIAKNKKDIFKDMHSEVDYSSQFKYAEDIGLGEIDYVLEKVSYEKRT